MASISSDDRKKLATLYTKYVGVSEFDLDLLQSVVRREASVAERGVISVSRGLLRELRAERNYISKMANQLAASA